MEIDEKYRISFCSITTIFRCDHYVRVEDQFEDRYGHHEILTNGGTVFSGFTSEGLQKNSNGSDRIGQSNRSASPVLLIRDEQDHYNNLLLDAIRNDKLRQFEKAYINHVEWCILTSAKLISPTIETENGNTNRANPQVELMRTKNSDEKLASSISGYDWCLEQLNRMALQSSATSFGFNSGLNFVHLADELELYKAAKHLRSRGFDEAMETFKSFERKDRMMVSKNNASGSSTLGNRQGSTTPGSNRTSSASARIISTAATNLSFLYLLQKKFDLAEKYADEAIAMDRYCIGAILNKGNLYYIQNDYQSATEFYHEVIANNSTVFEAYFNLALAERNLGNYDKALDALYRLQTIIRVSSGEQQNHTINQKIINSIQVELLYQIGSIYDSMGNQDQAKDYFQKVLNLVPTDIELLVKLADIALIENNRKQALNYLQEVRLKLIFFSPTAHRYFPSHIPTIERLASYYIEMKMYNQTIKHLQQLADIQPNEIRWQLMIAASYRRAGNHSQSLATYENIHQRFPENLDCLKFLLRLCSELNARDAHSYDNLIEKYSIILKRLEKTKELREEQKLTSSRSTTAAGRNSKNSFQSSREGSAATTNSSTNSSASGSSGYMTSFTNTGLKSITPTKTSLTNSLHSHNESQSNISAIVDEVVEQLDSNLKRPLTSWRRGDKINSNNENQFDEDFLIDTNLDEMLPD
ncbi:intraflagellar transport protein 88-like protein [Sarcoptes scabiei]|uniref:Intraflagellar transport protein 88-like protein n=1 Tax=Sarcoptes scabiei TaxID=52283 RepID=A0A131ZZN2_SARSC|nr:intraflagellar transport protein 88-like protein [Sarcoptes scabiei]